MKTTLSYDTWEEISISLLFFSPPPSLFFFVFSLSRACCWVWSRRLEEGSSVRSRSQSAAFEGLAFPVFVVKVDARHRKQQPVM